jgi:stage 0 sporulation regulatory protein
MFLERKAPQNSDKKIPYIIKWRKGLIMTNLHLKMLLLGQINIKRRVMYYKAKHFGFTHSSVVACSQELDTLLNKYQGI